MSDDTLMAIAGDSDIPSGQRRQKPPIELFVPDDRFAWKEFLLPVVALFAALIGAAYVTHPIVAFVLVVGIGVIQYRVYFPLHETSHFTLFRSRQLNVLAGNICAGLLATPFSRFRSAHLEHHRMFGTEHDPGGVDYFLRFESRGELVRFLLTPLVGASVLMKLADYWRAPAASDGRPKAAPLPFHELASIALMQALVLSILTGLDVSQWWRYPVFYLLPGATVFMFLSRLRMYLEHASLDYDKFDYLSSPRSTSRTIYASGWERAVLCGANFNYHHEHHSHPGVPAAHLPEFHKTTIQNGIEAEDIRLTYSAALAEIWNHLGRDKSAAQSRMSN